MIPEPYFWATATRSNECMYLRCRAVLSAIGICPLMAQTCRFAMSAYWSAIEGTADFWQAVFNKLFL